MPETPLGSMVQLFSLSGFHISQSFSKNDQKKTKQHNASLSGLTKILQNREHKCLNSPELFIKLYIKSQSHSEKENKDVSEYA